MKYEIKTLQNKNMLCRITTSTLTIYVIWIPTQL